MTNRRFLRCILLSLMMTTLLNASSITLFAAEPSLKQRTDQLVKPYLDNGIFVGMTIGLLHGGKQEVFGYGRLSQKDQRVPDGETIYEIGSLSKMITGLLLADAVVLGKIKLDQPAGELLPKGVKMPGGTGRAITLQDLSTHMSGLPPLPDNLKSTNLDNPYADYTFDDLYSFLNGYKQTRSPGEVCEFSILGAGLLGHLLELKANSPYDQLLIDRIATPLKMSSTRIMLDERLRAKLAPGHTVQGKPTPNWDIRVLAGAGAIRSTVNDLLRFAEANQSPSKDKLGDAIELAWKIHQQPLPAGGPALGLGWHIFPDGTHWHNGMTGGYYSMIMINREIKTSVVLLTNSAAPELEQLSIDILRMLTGANVEPRKFEKPIDVAAKDLQKFVGKYEFVPGLEMEVTAKEEKLFAKLTGQQAFQVFPRSETVWFPKEIEATITFTVDKSGESTSLELFQNGKKLMAKRIKKQTGKETNVPAKKLKKFLGKYQFVSGHEMDVTAEEEKLFVKLTGQQPFHVFPRSETVWYPKEVEATITFNVDKSGQFNSLELFQNGIKQTAKRIKTTVKAPFKSLQQFVGHYELVPGVEYSVAVEDEQLIFSLTGQPNIELLARTETVWFYKVLDATITITFLIDKKGECNSIEITQNGKNQSAKRIKNTIQISANELQKYVGKYELSPEAELEVTADSDRLMVTHTGQSTFEIFPRSETVWFYKVVDATMTFNLEKSGQCNSIEISQLGKKKIAKRIK